MEDLALSYGLLLASFGGPSAAGWVIGARLLPDRPLSVRWVASAVVAFALLVVEFLATVPWGLQRRCTFAAFGALLLGGAVVLRPRGVLRADLQALAGLLRSLASPTGVLLLPPLAVLGVAAARALLMPPLGWDSLTYHLFIAGRWVQGEGLSGLPTPDAMDGYARYPFFGQVVPFLILHAFHSDLAVNLAAFPFLALAAISVHGIARHLGVSRRDASLTACLVVCSPVVLAYVTTAYVDLPMAALLLAALLLLVSHLDAPNRRLPLLAALAMGLALGVKQVALGWIGVVLILRIATIVRAAPGPPLERLLRAIVGIVPETIVLVVIAAPPYVRNWWETGNPLYPNGLALGGVTLFPASEYQSFLLEGTESRRPPPPHLASWPILQLFRYAGPSLPPTPGWPFLPLAIASILGSIRRARRPSLLGVSLAAFAWLPVCLFFLDSSPGNLLTRRLWMDSATRLLIPSLAIWAVAGIDEMRRWRVPSFLIRSFGTVMPTFHGALARVLAASERIRLKWDFPLAATLVGLAVHLGHANLSFLSPRAGALLLAVLATLSIGWTVFVLFGHRASIPFRLVWITILLMAPMAGLPWLETYREETRYVHYRRHVDLHDFPRKLVPGWEALDRPSSPHRVAIATGFEWPGHHWWFYPVMGSRLQNRVLVIDLTSDGRPRWRVLSEGTDWEAEFPGWWKRLRASRADRLFVWRPDGPEAAWARKHPDRFALLDAGEDQSWSLFAIRDVDGDSPPP